MAGAADDVACEQATIGPRTKIITPTNLLTEATASCYRALVKPPVHPRTTALLKRCEALAEGR